jgi:ribosomal protein L7/L12
MKRPKNDFLKENIEKKEAEEIVAKFKEAGATCEIK